MERWSTKYSECLSCGKNSSLHACKGVCQRCYQRKYQQINKEKSKEYRRKKYVSRAEFSKTPCTLKKLTYLVAQELFGYRIKKVPERIEKSKNFIRNVLPQDCRQKYIDNWDNDFISMTQIFGIDHSDLVLNRLKGVPKTHRTTVLKNSQTRKYVVMIRMEFYYRKPIFEILKDLYLEQRMSSYQIESHILKITDLSVTYRTIQNWLDKMGILRSHVKALRNRIVTGRMDYLKRNIDYSRIARLNKVKKKKEISKAITIQAPLELKDKVQELAQNSHRTMSEVVRDVYRLLNLDLGNKYNYSRYKILGYGINKFEDELLKGRLKSKRAVKVVLAIDRSLSVNSIPGILKGLKIVEVIHKTRKKNEEQASTSEQEHLKESSHTIDFKRSECLFEGCKVKPRSGEYCATHKTPWRRKHALEIQQAIFNNTSTEEF